MSSDSDNPTCTFPSSASLFQNSATKAHLSTLTRIVKAQIGLLASNLTKENYAKIAPEMKGLVETHGEDIRQHLIRLLLAELYKQAQGPADGSPQLLQLRECIGSITTENSDDSNPAEAFVTFAETFAQFCKSESAASLVQLDSFFTQLNLDSFERFALSSLLSLTAKESVADQAKTIASRNFKDAIEQLSNLGSLPGTLLSWCVDAISESVASGFEYFNNEDIQIFAYLVPDHCTDKSVIDKVRVILGQRTTKNDDDDNSDSRENLLTKRILEAGYECCSSFESLRELFGDICPEEKDVAVALGCMARTYTNMSGVGNGSPAESNWNVENFVTVIEEKAPNLDWMKVIEDLDYPHFFVYDAKGLNVLVRAWRQSAMGSAPFPANKFFGKWRNLKGQLSALYQMASAPVDVLSTTECSEHKVIELDDFANSSAHVRSMAAQLYKNQLNSLDLIECVLDLSDTVVSGDVKVFIEMMVNMSPELAFLGFLQAQSVKTAYQKDILSRLLLIYLTGNPSSALVLTKLWLVNPDFFFKSILEMYGSDNTSLSHILDILHELKILPVVLDYQPFFFAIDLAALASHREFLNLDKWLQEKIAGHKDVFIRACLDFLSQKVAAEISRQETNSAPTTVPLSFDVINTFLKVLSESQMLPENAELLKDVHAACMEAYPKLANPRGGIENRATEAEVSFSADVEKEANSYYERIYSGEMTIDEMTERLTKLSQSKIPRDQDVYACMIHNLFDEYHFFPKYPDKELSITSVLFGTLIQHHLVSSVSLGVALRCIIDALNNPIGSKMFNFGHQALLQFQSRLAEWPQFCISLLQIPQLQQSNRDLVRYITAIIQAPQPQQQDAPATSQQSDLPGSLDNNTVAQHSVFTAIRVPPPATDDDGTVYSTPAEASQDRILFIINNVAPNNIDEKLIELSKVLNKTAYQWFSNYLVQKRVSLEPNYHELYLLLLDSLNSRLLYQHVLRETYVNIQVLLNSDKTVTSSSERSLLKNLGSWLGGITLARNKPIRHKHLAFKELLLEGFDSNRLIVVIPFVCKVLEQCSKSVVFKPPNPWLMAILKLLVELYQFADLKLNLKFEIEVLCKGLSIELNEIKATSILQNRPPQDHLVKNTVRDKVDIAGPATQGKSPGPSIMASEPFLNDGPFGESALSIPNIAPYLVFNPQIVMYTSQPASKRWVLQAITQSIQEIIEPVVERSVAIAAVSTRELITKDFAVESDEGVMRKAAHLMTQSLAGSLAMVTCKEPLRQTMTNSLCTIFMENGLTDSLAEQAAFVTVADNLDMVCAIIEKAAMERATVEIDELLMNAYASRRKHREQRPGQAYFDMDIFSMTRYPVSLPEPLRAKPSGLHPGQFRVYEDFAMISRTAPETFETEDVPLMTRPDAAAYSYGYNPATPVAGDMGYGGMASQSSTHQILARFTQYLEELEKLANQTNAPSLASLPPMHDIRAIIRQIPMLAQSSFDKVEASRVFAQNVVSRLYRCETQLAIETFVVLLERLCEISPNVGTLVTYWLTHVDDERKYNIPVTIALIKAGLINLAEQDQELGRLIDSGRLTAIDFAAQLIHACVIEENMATPQDIMVSLEALGRLRGKVPESVIILMNDLRGNPQGQGTDLRDGERGIRGQLRYLFAEWVQLCQHPSTTEKAQNIFLHQLSQQNIFKSEDMSLLFFRVCLETSIDRAINFKQIPSQSPGAAYQLIDVFSKLVVGLLKVPADNPGPESNAARVNLFSKVLSVSVLLLAQYHEHDRRQFNQRPFLRLFTCLLSDLHASEQHLQGAYLSILLTLNSTLYTLQPSSFPGFAFAWLQLLSHRLFMPKLLLSENQKGWPAFLRLLICLFQFLVPFLRYAELRETTRALYRGTLRVLLILLHDFPEFLSDYHFSFCDVIPPSCTQLRNLILSAFPRNMRLPDPFTPNLKVDLLPEINQAPRILSDYVGPLVANNLKQEIDEYLDSDIPSELMVGLADRLKLEPAQQTIDNHTPSTYNIPLMNALVFYTGVMGIMRGIPVNQGAPMEIYHHLLSELDPEGRYIFLSAIANQLRYPNSHTHYFSCVLLYLFSESDQEIVKEQITRVLLERLIVNRPHPWGLLITFIELIKNPRYNFWNHSFTRCATDIERLFESVSRSINQI